MGTSMTESQQKDRFRPFLVVVTLLAWALFLWMATHRSEQASYFGYSKSYLALLVVLGCGAIVTTLLHWGPVYRWLYTRRLNIIVPIVTTVLGLGVLELAVRFIDPAGISYYAYAKRYHLAKLADDEVFYRHPSDWSARYGDVEVTTNAYGFRSAPITDKQADEFRVLFLGDSVTFGWGVDQGAVFATRVADMLSPRLGRPVTTINTGVGSYNTDNQFKTLRRHHDALDPNIVVLLYVSNDIEPTPETAFDPSREVRMSDKSPPEVIKLVLGRSWTYRLVAHLRQFGGGGGSAGLNTESAGWAQSAQALRDLIAYCEARDLPLVVLMYRPFPTPLETEISAQLADITNGTDAHFADVYPWFEGRDMRVLLNSAVDSHPNADGHTVLAEGITDLIATLDLAE